MEMLNIKKVAGALHKVTTVRGTLDITVRKNWIEIGKF